MIIKHQRRCNGEAIASIFFYCIKARLLDSGTSTAKHAVSGQ